MYKRLKELCEGLPASLVRQSFFLLAVYFAFAALLLYFSKQTTAPHWLKLYAFQAYLLMACLYLYFRGWRFCWRVSLRILYISVALIFAYLLLLKLVDIFLRSQNIPPVQIEPTFHVSVLILQLLLAPVLEELFFRDFIFRAIFQQMGSPARALFFMSGFFMLAHLSVYPGAFLLGLISGVLFVYTGSLVPGMLFHFVSNLSIYFLPAFMPHLMQALESWGLLSIFYL